MRSIDGHCPRCLGRGLLEEVVDEFPDAAPLQMGDYLLVEKIAQGGMGAVYRAQQRSLGRSVAVKVLLAGDFATARAQARFRAEAQAAARLAHPNIVPIYEVGAADGIPFFSMELIDGQTLAEAIRTAPPAPRRAAEILQAIAGAVQHAHEHGVLHRDLKPSNILLDRGGVPRVTDFGLARMVENTDLTLSGHLLGTPAYIAPEFITRAAALGDVDGPTASTERRANSPDALADVYSLGATLYHALTGRPPFQGESVEAVLLQVQNGEPVAPRRLNPSVPVDLETICLKCMEKDPARRFASAAMLADELGRFLRDEPIHARPASAASKLWRFCRRRPAIAGLITVVLALLSIVAAGSIAAALRISAARKGEHGERLKSEAANVRLGETVSLLELERAETFFRAGDAGMGVAQLAATLRRDPRNHIAASRLVSALVHRNWVLPAAPPMPHGDRVVNAWFSPDGQRVLTASGDNTARIWDAASGTCVLSVHHDGAVNSARYDPSGSTFVTASSDGSARIWNARDGEPITAPLRHDAAVYRAEFSPDGRTVVTASADKTAKLWDALSGAIKQEFRSDGEVLEARFSPDGERLAIGAADGTVRICNVSTGETVRLDVQPGRVNWLAFSPDGRRLVVAGSEGGQALLWNTETGERIGAALSPGSQVWCAVFSPNNAFVITTSENGDARIWNSETGQPLGWPMHHEGGVRFAEFSSDGGVLATTSMDNSVRLWQNVNTGARPFSQPLREPERVTHLGFSPDHQRLVTASNSASAQVWDIRLRSAEGLAFRHESDVRSVAFGPRGESLLSASPHRTQLWDPRTGQALGAPTEHAEDVRVADLSADGKSVVTGGFDGAARIREATSGKLIAGPMQHRALVRSARFSPDASRVVTASYDGTARVWDSRSGRPITPPLEHSDQVRGARFSASGRFVVTVSKDRTARVWDARTGEPLCEPLLHRDHVESAEFSADETRVVTASSDNTARVWEIPSGRPVGAPLRHLRSVQHAVFSPDGRKVATASLDRFVRLWDAATGAPLAEPIKHNSAVSFVSFSPDGVRILTGTWSGLAQIWDANTGRPLTEWLGTGGTVLSACFDPMGRRIATGAEGGAVRVWEVPPIPAPVPRWFLTMAEAAAGIRLGAHHEAMLVPRHELAASATQVRQSAGPEFYARLARWFLADPAQRDVSPFQ